MDLQTLSRRILRRILLGCLGLTLVLGLAHAGWEYSKTMGRVSSEFERLSHSFAPGLVDALWYYQEELVQTMVQGIAENPVVGSVRVEDAAGQVVSQRARAHASMSDQSLWGLPVVSVDLGRDGGDGWQKLGRLVIVPDAGLLRAQIRDSLLASLLMAALFTLAIWLMVRRIVTRTVAVPLARLTGEIEAAGGSPGAQPLSYPFRDDIGVLVDALNGMRARLVAANRELEARVEERTRHLAETTGRLRESENRLNTILDSVEAFIYIKDGDYRYRYANQQTCKLLGRPLSEVVGHDDSEFFDPGTQAAIRDNDRRVIEHGERVEAEEVRRLADGGQAVNLSVKIPLRDESGRIYALCAISTDITERKAAQEALAQYGAELERTVAERTQALSAALDAAEQASRAKAEFLANMSHEIRTPMNAVMGMTLLALRADPPPKVHDYLQKIQSSSRHLLGVINDILDFSKIEAHKLSLEHVEFELESVLGELANVCAEKAFGKGLEFVIDIAQDIPKALVGDALRLGQVLINLANNAIKFTERGEVSIQVTLQQRRSDGVLLRFAVHDTGIGLSEPQRQGLFQSFQQADSSITRKFGGTGLGLAISKRLVELMGGEIGVESVAGAGSTFWFTAHLELGAGQVRPGPMLPDLSGLKALVVDDNEHARQVLVEMLRSMGFDALPVAGGQSALAELEQADRASMPFGLVLLDWRMPGMDGIEFAAALRRLPLAQPPLLLMATAYDRDEARPLAAAVGIREVLAKPVTPSALLDAVTRQFVGAVAVLHRPERNEARLLVKAEVLLGARALLVEDNEVNQEVATEFLQALGLQVELAGNGAAALRMVQQGDYDVVLMDMQMPVMDGLSATREIRQLPGLQELPILAMTANAMAGDRQRCLDAGMNDHIAKPIDPRDLTDKLLRWVRPDPARAGRASAGAQAMVVAPVRADQAWLQALGGVEGLDTRLGLGQAGGREPLYGRLLAKFLADQADVPDRLAQAIAASDWSEAERVAHTLKGVSAQIGATALRDAAASLEQLIQQRASPAELELLLAQVAQLLPPLLQALAAALPQDKADAPAAAFDPRQWQALRERLIGLLQEDDTEAVALFDANTALARQGLGPRFDLVAQALGQFDFGVALEVITQA
ncbi:response regulator [Malikia sp.]|uniref:hybrid sensor histidine kinase/response regulator n=1 Tax=Malikia sp. TaxID=2070706 RepID=UPI002630C5C7|nr:response regulator [Malikia sp.]MDD2729453.1 response regulator [Malikia sp.]